MQASIEISMYPLTSDYETPIIDFIKELKANPNLQVFTNPLSTQVFGELSVIMQTLEQAMQHTWARNHKSCFVVKFLAGNLSPKDGNYLLEFN